MATRRKRYASSRARKPRPDLEGRLAGQLDEAGLGGYEREYRFHDTRRWRFDFAFVPKLLAVEVEGAIFTGGRHSRGAGMMADMEKYNTAATMGWTVLRVAGPHITSGEAVEWIKQTLKGRRARRAA